MLFLLFSCAFFPIQLCFFVLFLCCSLAVCVLFSASVLKFVFFLCSSVEVCAFFCAPVLNSVVFVLCFLCCLQKETSLTGSAQAVLKFVFFCAVVWQFVFFCASVLKFVLFFVL